MLNSSAAMAVFGAAAAVPLIAAAGADYQLSLSLVAASPMYCPTDDPAPTPFFDIYPVYDVQYGESYASVVTVG